jgi:Reverse transcriptase (RNA-dependent DNA polymerase)
LAGSPIFLVKKKDNTLRPVIDYRHLNEITVQDRYFLPLLSSFIKKLAGATVFTKLDLNSAYNLVRDSEKSQFLTAFCTRFGHFEYRVMPFGLTNAPAAFQHFVNSFFSDVLDVFVLVYLDDILIFSKSSAEHSVHVNEVLTRLSESKLFVNKQKCVFASQKVSFLGNIVSAEGEKPEKENLKTISD